MFRLRIVAVLALLICCAAERGAAAQPAPNSHARQRAVPHRADLVPDAAASRSRLDDVWIGEHNAVYRDATGTVRVRALADGHVLATTPARGKILCANDDRLVLLRTERPASISTLVQLRRIVFVDLHSGTERVSAPLPLPDWVVTTSENEPAEHFVAWFENDDVVIAWNAALGWRGGVAPPNDEAARVRTADGSFRVDSALQFVAGGEITFPERRAARSPVAPRSYMQQLDAGEGVVWLNEIDPRTSVATHSFVDGRATRTVTWAALTHRGFVHIGGVWVRDNRVVALRQVHDAASQYEIPRALDVLDRSTGRSLWHDDVAVLQILPPRP